jgi:hypothetical protein
MGPGRGSQGTPAPEVIGFCIIIFHTNFTFFYQICFFVISHKHKRNVLEQQLSTFIPQDSKKISFTVIASYIMSFDCHELTHAHCLACCFLVSWESWQDNLQNVARNMQDSRQRRHEGMYCYWIFICINEITFLKEVIGVLGYCYCGF